MKGGKPRSKWYVVVRAARLSFRFTVDQVHDGDPQASGISGGKIQSDSKGGGIGRSVGGFIDPKLNWSDIGWLRRQTRLPIGLKGIQTAEVCDSIYKQVRCDESY